jgi:hypothetical protein
MKLKILMKISDVLCMVMKKKDLMLRQMADDKYLRVQLETLR